MTVQALHAAALVTALVLTTDAGARAGPSSSASSGHQAFKAHLAERDPCKAANARWLRHYAPYTRALRQKDHRVRTLFDTVVSQMVAAHLPTEYALIPFVESHYKPAARSGFGPAGLWQFTAPTARNHGLTVRGKVDQRMDAVRSTAAAIKYLKYLHRMFKGDTRQVLMAFNAGEGRLLAARRQQGKGLSAITRVYPDKIRAIACDVLRHSD